MQPWAWELSAKEQRRNRRFSKNTTSADWTSVVSMFVGEGELAVNLVPWPLPSFSLFYIEKLEKGLGTKIPGSLYTCNHQEYIKERGRVSNCAYSTCNNRWYGS